MRASRAATRCWCSPDRSLARLPSGPGSAPATARAAVRTPSSRIACFSATSRPRSRSSPPSGSSAAARARSASTASVTGQNSTSPAPMLIRSLASVALATAQPALTSPTTSASGMNTSSRKTSLNIASPVISRSGRTVTPGGAMSTTSIVMPLCLGASGSVRTVARPRLADRASLVQTFWPPTRQPPSARTARAVSGPGFRARDPPAAVRPDGAGGDRRGVGARARLAEQLAPAQLTVEARPCPAVQLLAGAVPQQRRHDPGADTKLRAFRPRQLLLDDELLDRAGAPAVGGGPVREGVAGPREQPGPLARRRLQPGCAELPHLLPVGLGLRRQVERGVAVRPGDRVPGDVLRRAPGRRAQ